MRRRRYRQRPAVGILGKGLTRRSRGACELCESRDKTRPFELPPFPEDPDPERTVMACDRCRDWLEKERADTEVAHFLCAAVWSEHRAVRLAAARMLTNCVDPTPWMQEALESANIDPDTREFRPERP